MSCLSSSVFSSLSVSVFPCDVVLCCVWECMWCLWWCVCGTLKKTNVFRFRMSACIHSKRPRVYWHTWGHFECTHADILTVHTRDRVEGRVRRQPRVFIVFFFFQKKKTFLGHLNWMLGSLLIASLLLSEIGPRRVLTHFRGSPKSDPLKI